jgi:hypothetical protein
MGGPANLRVYIKQACGVKYASARTAIVQIADLTYSEKTMTSDDRGSSRQKFG